ncbi:MAG TPA: hypothetical protein VNB54_10215 [Alphaproteobacteria bacterium]|nr:hypothetical protein [Alphaproteobacteria bacterium]
MAAEAFLLWAIPIMGIIYLPLATLLTGAVAIIPYREYRRLQRAAIRAGNFPSRESVATNLQKLTPHLRVSTVSLLGLATAADIFLFLVPGSLPGRILPASIMLLAIVLFCQQLLRERSIVANYVATWAKIISFDRRRRGRSAIYEYESPAGGTITGKGGSLREFSVGMSVPVLYNSSKPDESLPVPNFIFYEIRA